MLNRFFDWFLGGRSNKALRKENAVLLDKVKRRDTALVLGVSDWENTNNTLQEIYGELDEAKKELAKVREERNMTRIAFDKLRTHRDNSANWTAGRKTKAFLDSLNMKNSEFSSLSFVMMEWIEGHLTDVEAGKLGVWMQNRAAIRATGDRAVEGISNEPR